MNYNEELLLNEIKNIIDEKFKEFYLKISGHSNKINPKLINEDMTMNEVCNYLEVSRVTVQNWISSFKIESIKRGNKRFFKREYITLFKKTMEENYMENLPIRKSYKHPDNIQFFKKIRSEY